MIKIVILAENYADKAENSEAGFSAYIEFDKTKILFDTGISGTCVLKNAKDLNIDLRQTDYIAISHGHYDHANGLEKVLEQIGSKKILCHSNIFKNRFSQHKDNFNFSGLKNTKFFLESNLSATFSYYKSFTQISEQIYISGEVPFTNEIEKIPEKFIEQDNFNKKQQDTFEDENSLVFDTPKGLIILTGCAHRGIVNICEYAFKKLNKPIYGIIGGFHLKNVSTEQLGFVINWIKEKEIELIAPAHCTGIDVIYKFKSIFGSKVIPAFCGQEFYID